MRRHPQLVGTVTAVCVPPHTSPDYWPFLRHLFQFGTTAPVFPRMHFDVTNDDRRSFTHLAASPYMTDVPNINAGNRTANEGEAIYDP